MTSNHLRHQTPLARAMLLALGLASGTALLPVVAIAADPAPARISTASLELEMTAAVQKALDKMPRIDGQGQHIKATVKLDRKRMRVLINLSEEFRPDDAGAELEDQLSWLHNAADWVLISKGLEPTGSEVTIGGQSLQKLFPEWFKVTPDKKSSVNPALAGSVVASAGHGIYYHYKFKDWRAQRDPSNGITEDFITPSYATELSTWLAARSGATVSFPRSNATDLHTPSGQPWWKLAGRYHLETLYPDNPEIWHSLPNSKKPLRERDEDINSRPLFANHIGAGALISLHTDGAPDPTATGATGYFKSGHTASQTLATSIMCYMEELIHAKAAYENYRIVKTPRARSDLGELNLANMPAVIIETGFHTNPTDAAALQDPVFRTASMKGVEKGYRLVQEGKTDCTPFAITKIPDVTGPQNVPIPVKVHYKGYPQFAVTAKVEIVTCPSGWTCSGGSVNYPTKIDSPLSYNFTCSTPFPKPSATFRLKTTLTDLDEVKTKSVEHNVTCTPTSSHRGSGQHGSSTFTIGS
jgi:N-acetylmuramoyl-L-alanine amidase